MAVALVVFRNDLRLDDNPALQGALEGGFDIVPVHVHDHDAERAHGGAASDAWRARSLTALDADLARRGNRLRVFDGDMATTLVSIASQCDAQAVFLNKRFEPDAAKRDARIVDALAGQGLDVQRSNASLLFEPTVLKTGKGGPYRVFTPFHRAAQAQWSPNAQWDAPDRIPGGDVGPAGIGIDALTLSPTPRWDASFWTRWTPGEAGAREAVEIFLDDALRAYAEGRDRPDRAGTSRLSPHLHFGEIAPWRVVHAVDAMRGRIADAQIDAFVRQLVWREFAAHLLHHFPHTVTKPLNAQFEQFDWATPTRDALDAWRHGRTGVPIVDAGMRELWATGWMHNRVRMLVASYLCKHMRVHWLEGQRWFQDTLVDADLANNVMGWQWVAGTGADASPYFRIFNPVTQAERFDPRGDYIAQWVPELASLPPALRHAPWRDPQRVGPTARDYPALPLVDLAAGRDAALLAYRRMRATAAAVDDDA